MDVLKDQKDTPVSERARYQRPSCISRRHQSAMRSSPAGGSESTLSKHVSHAGSG